MDDQNINILLKIEKAIGRLEGGVGAMQADVRGLRNEVKDYAQKRDEDCKDINGRVRELEDSKSYLRGGISVWASVGAILVAVGTAIFVALFKH